MCSASRLTTTSSSSRATRRSSPASSTGRTIEPGLERRVAHLVGHLGRVEPDEPEPDVRVLAPEVGREVGDQVGGGRPEHAEAERAAAEVAHLGDGVAGPLDVGEHALGLGPEAAARLGQHEAAAGAGEEGDPELAPRAGAPAPRSTAG